MTQIVPGTDRRRTVHRLAAVVVLLVVMAACGGSGSSAARSASAVTDDVLRLFERRSFSQVARGALEPVPDVLSRNRALVDDAFRQPAFATAVQQADAAATPAVQSKVQQWFGRADAYVQRKAENRLRRMICEARLYASRQAGDVTVVGDWVTAQFAQDGINLGPLHPEVTAWVTDQVNDRTSPYTLACIAWARAA